MKKLIALLLAVVMVLGLAACGGSSSTPATEAPVADATEAPAAMTAEEKALAEAEIRYAISLLFDRNYIVDEIGQAGQVPASSFVAMGMTNPDGTEFYKTANGGAAANGYDGYYNVAKEAHQANVDKALEILAKYYDLETK